MLRIITSTVANTFNITNNSFACNLMEIQLIEFCLIAKAMWGVVVVVVVVVYLQIDSHSKERMRHLTINKYLISPNY